ncbi:unnamed protein product [Ilex paraguariensis]|uniref:Uncharacterized protein n=1 Tax=Ilex paraguariensis TaxID=185542 RepID=A0ABC8TDL3_9AQUA
MECNTNHLMLCNLSCEIEVSLEINNLGWRERKKGWISEGEIAVKEKRKSCCVSVKVAKLCECETERRKGGSRSGSKRAAVCFGRRTRCRLSTSLTFSRKKEAEFASLRQFTPLSAMTEKKNIAMFT